MLIFGRHAICACVAAAERVNKYSQTMHLRMPCSTLNTFPVWSVPRDVCMTWRTLEYVSRILSIRTAGENRLELAGNVTKDSSQITL